ncbi:DUF2117 domain-containing protein [Candidatus Methanocrinis natronophilus]|uniref:DUF2117 domain-containing protein n=1 Tax=Candidatus Methanocrinis natronophilus TaxID=3033396 RepID=A0ABT5X735_9EURY|nr:DUF2117 domain-containing protein [Candidatus Methanocrinis natronophilus]MDF0590514.1 DUF2117 domain-containing protein [Candidatus Methanocrinis natronophilus]
MRASKAVDEIGVVVHGPEVVDLGFAEMAIDRLSDLGTVTAVLGGTMGRAAVIDGSLEDRIEISSRELPSRSVKRLEGACDFVLLLNYAKTRETGLAFGAMVAARARPNKPLLIADYGGGYITHLAGEGAGIAEKLAAVLELELVDPPRPPSRLDTSGGTVRRRMEGAVPGEKITVNGMVVGTALQEKVEISTEDGKIVDISGAQLKLHGVEKLPSLDLEKAILRTGEIRRTRKVPRSASKRGVDAVLIDHAAEEAFERADGAMVAVTVGDDTTAIAGDILSRLGIPIVGVVDGDLDHLCERTAAPKGSVVIEVSAGCDDLIGIRVKEEIFGGGDRISMEGLGIEDIVTGVKRAAGGDLRKVRRF